MGVDYKIADGYRIFILILCGGLALVTLLFAGALGQSGRASAQISPLSPLTVATPLPQEESQPPQVIATDTPAAPPASQPPAESPGRGPVQPQNIQQSSAQPETLAQDAQPLIPLGEPSEASPSLILIGALLVGLVLLVVLVLVVRRRE